MSAAPTFKPSETLEGTVAELLAVLAQYRSAAQQAARKANRATVTLVASVVFLVILTFIQAPLSDEVPEVVVTHFLVFGMAAALQIVLASVGLLRTSRKLAPRVWAVILIAIVVVVLVVLRDHFFLDPVRGAFTDFHVAGLVTGILAAFALRLAVVMRVVYDPSTKRYISFAWPHAFLEIVAERFGRDVKAMAFGYESAHDPSDGTRKWDADPHAFRAADLVFAFDGTTAMRVVADMEITHRTKRNPRGKRKYKGAITQVDLSIAFVAPDLTKERGAAAAAFVQQSAATWEKAWSDLEAPAKAKLSVDAGNGHVTASARLKVKAATYSNVKLGPPPAAFVCDFATALGRVLA